MARHTTVIILPPEEARALGGLLASGGREAAWMAPGADAAALAGRQGAGVVVVDAGDDPERVLAPFAGEPGAGVLAIVPDQESMERLLGDGRFGGEIVVRPCSAKVLYWRVEAMLARAEDAEGAADAPERLGKVVPVFNPKGGVGKTTISVNLSDALARAGRRVLLLDCDGVSGHVRESLGMGPMANAAGSWDGSPTSQMRVPLSLIATPHGPGLDVLTMAAPFSRLSVSAPAEVAGAISDARRDYDWVVCDMHPDYDQINLAIFDVADRIVVPTTPDIPSLRAAIQMRSISAELGFLDRLVLVPNRADSGIAGRDVERVVGLPVACRVRSAGMLVVRATNAGRSVAEERPGAKIVGDFRRLAARLMADAGDGVGRRPARATIGRLRHLAGLDRAS